jgi:hypothetical protein
MRHLRPIATVLAIAALLVACSSTPGASSGDGGGGSSQPGASAGGGGGGDSVNGGGGGGSGGDFSHGSATYHITGDYTADGELGFIPEASQIDNNGTYSLSFSDQANTVLVIILSAGMQTLSYGDDGHTIGGAQCDFNITRQDSDGAAGSFTCNDELLVTSAGSTSGSANISGEFDAHR